ncbi:hypothetical protein ADUPG1_012203, partial [Aduncisulcus paluster]
MDKIYEDLDIPLDLALGNSLSSAEWKAANPICPVCRTEFEETVISGSGKLLTRDINLLKVAHLSLKLLFPSKSLPPCSYSSPPMTNVSVISFAHEVLVWDKNKFCLKLEGVLPVPSSVLRQSPFLPALSPFSVSYPGGGRLVDLIASWRINNEISKITLGTVGCFLLLLYQAQVCAVECGSGLMSFSANDIFLSSEALLWLKSYFMFPISVQQRVKNSQHQNSIFVLPRPCSLEAMKITQTKELIEQYDSASILISSPSSLHLEDDVKSNPTHSSLHSSDSIKDSGMIMHESRKEPSLYADSGSDQTSIGDISITFNSGIFTLMEELGLTPFQFESIITSKDAFHQKLVALINIDIEERKFKARESVLLGPPE